MFKVDPAGNETIVYTFSGPGGAYPAYGALVQDQAGNLYGATSDGGGNDAGVVFELTPRALDGPRQFYTVLPAEPMEPTPMA